MNQTTETVRLGALISTSQKKILKQKMKLDKRYSFLAALAAEASESPNLTLYFFSPEDVDVTSGDIHKALYWDRENNKWYECSAPSPEVVYERIYVKNELVDRVRTFFSDNNVPFINARANFNKLICHQKLSEDVKTSPYLPPAIEVRKIEDIHRFLKVHDVIYLKKVISSLGKGVIKLEKTAENSIKYSYYKSRLRTQTVKSIYDLKPVLHRFFHNKTYIAQRGIPLIKIGDQSIDFRAEVQRGKNGIIISGVCARAGLKNSPITVHSTAMPYELFLKEHLHYSEQNIKNTVLKVEEFLTTIYSSLEDAYGPFGEIGIDFGIDTNRDIWFIEANSKSAKVSFEKSYGDAGLRENAFHLLEYAESLHQKEPAQEG
ncbi:YheC/YheD family protein [Alteribacter keqinensis]|nr:YheC/YheD family protein [Alteribacter keqinensis]